MRSALITICATVLLMSVGCGKSSNNDAPERNRSSPTAETPQGQAAEAETPQEAAAAIAELFKDEDYETLVLERYSEWERTKNMPESGSPEEALLKAVAVFERHPPGMVEFYGLLSEAEFAIQDNPRPQPGETDKMAVAIVTFNGREGEVKLYLMESGRWGFHL